MKRHVYMSCTTVLAILYVGTMFVPITARGETRRGSVVIVEGATQTWRVLDKSGQEVEVEVPSQSLVDIKTGKTRQQATRDTSAGRGEVSATVVAVDTVTNRVKLRTQHGQVIEVDTPAAGVRMGEKVKIVIP